MKTMLLTAAQVAAIVIVSAAGIILVTRVIGGPSLSINQISTNKQSTFDVQGESKVITVPDQAEVQMGISVNEATVKVAQDRANTIINDINTKLGELGIEKKNIKTENYSLYPNYDYSSGSGQRITSYTVNTNLVVTMSDFAKLNQAIDLATQAGANQIGSISFTLSDDKRAKVEEEARQEAISNAKDKASDLASLAGMRLGKIVNVMETPQNRFPDYPTPMMMAEGKGAGGGSPTNVEPGSTTYTYTVTLSYETL
ncbi:MAG TPA: SIMPL domain-containing protein [Vitreimonas sp.]|nr:SIMPL domain-containing protein [Vitreimonas sp.]